MKSNADQSMLPDKDETITALRHAIAELEAVVEFNNAEIRDLRKRRDELLEVVSRLRSRILGWQ